MPEETYNLRIYTVDYDNEGYIDAVAVQVKDAASNELLAEGETDGSNGFLAEDLPTDALIYITFTKEGYEPWFPDAWNFLRYKGYEDAAIWVVMHRLRSKSQVFVCDPTGAPLAGAVVVVKNSSHVVVETIETDANGIALMDETGGIYQVGADYTADVSLEGYNPRTIALNDWRLGITGSATLSEAIEFETVNFSLRLIDVYGKPIIGRTLQLSVVAPKSVEEDGIVYYIATGQTITFTTNADGIASVDLIKGLIVKPSGGWNSYFGYPENVIWVLNDDVNLGDGTAGVL